MTKFGTWNKKTAFHKWNDFCNKTKEAKLETTLMTMTEEFNNLDLETKQLTLEVSNLTN